MKGFSALVYFDISIVLFIIIPVVKPTEYSLESPQYIRIILYLLCILLNIIFLILSILKKDKDWRPTKLNIKENKRWRMVNYFFFISSAIYILPQYFTSIEWKYSFALLIVGSVIFIGTQIYYLAKKRSQ